MELSVRMLKGLTMTQGKAVYLISLFVANIRILIQRETIPSIIFSEMVLLSSQLWTFISHETLLEHDQEI